MTAQTMMFRARIIQPNGDITTRRIEARSEEEGRKLLGVRPSQIHSIAPDQFFAVITKLNTARASLDVQANVLAVFSAQVSSGAGVAGSFDNVVGGYSTFRKKMDECRRTPKISDKMRLLNFDPELQLLAEVGEQSGMIGDVLGNAADDIIERQKVLGEIRKKLIPSLGVALFGLILMLTLPCFMVSSLLDMRKARGVVLNENFLTKCFVFLGLNVPEWWWAMIAAVIGIAVTIKYWWKYVRRLPILSAIDDFIRVTAAYRFIASFLPLISRGVPLKNAVEIMRKFASGRSRVAYDNLYDFLGRGGSVSRAFEDDYWFYVLRDCMRGFDSMRATEQVGLLRRMKPLLLVQINRAGGKINGVFGMVGLFMALATVLMLFIGLQYPMITMKTPLMGG